MKETILETRYAKGLFDFALDQDLLEEVKNDMEALLKVCESNRDFILMLRSPVIKSDKKNKVIAQIFAGILHEVTLSYLRIITEKHREAYIAGIARQFIDLYREHKGIKVAYLVTATAVSEEMRENIRSLLEKYTNATIELIEEIDNRVIGGFILRFDGNQYDASLATKIHELKREFEKNVYVRGF
jgi:F-type H+-transporting ATPase subunit delta